jgi:hypothetical protein
VLFCRKRADGLRAQGEPPAADGRRHLRSLTGVPAGGHRRHRSQNVRAKASAAQIKSFLDESVERWRAVERTVRAVARQGRVSSPLRRRWFSRSGARNPTRRVTIGPAVPARAHARGARSPRALAVGRGAVTDRRQPRPLRARYGQPSRCGHALPLRRNAPSLVCLAHRRSVCRAHSL